MATGTVISTSRLNVRSIASATGHILGKLPSGSRVTILGTTGDWLRISLWHAPSSDAVSVGYLHKDWVLIDSTPALPKVKLGVNILNRHEAVGFAAGDQGCRFFLVLNNPGFASTLKNRYPDADVMVRIWWNRHKPSVDEAITRMDGCSDSRLIYTGLNEADEVGQNENGIQDRASFDVQMAQRIRAISGARYAAGTFSMGEPDFTKSSICDVMRAAYAPHYNSGLIWWDHHLYSPNMKFGTDQGTASKWFETRWQFLFTHCGFNPASPSRIVCSETGVDEGGVGGFPAHGATNTDVVRWGNWWIAEQLRALPDTCPVVGGAIFQIGNHEDWAGYNVEGYFGGLKTFWT